MVTATQRDPEVRAIAWFARLLHCERVHARPEAERARKELERLGLTVRRRRAGGHR